MARITDFQAHEYAEAYTDEAWAGASGHAWDQLAAIDGEVRRGEMTVDRAKELIDETRLHIKGYSLGYGQAESDVEVLGYIAVEAKAFALEFDGPQGFNTGYRTAVGVRAEKIGA